MRKPVAILIADVHFSLKTLELASSAMRQAVGTAASLGVPLVVAGDLHDTKANMRGECIKAMIDVFEYAEENGVETRVIVGNHCLINEKGSAHSLEFLRPWVQFIIQSPVKLDGIYYLPYFSDPDALRKELSSVPAGSTIILHQGVQGAVMGDYVIDHSSLPRECFKNFRCISGHYHRAQDIKCGDNTFTYIGSPYSMTFAEANDGPKGFRVLYDDGTLDSIPTNLRKHVIIEANIDDAADYAYVRTSGQEILDGDLVWLKISGPSLVLSKLNKSDALAAIGKSVTLRLDLLPTDSPESKADDVEGMTSEEAFDRLIDTSPESPEHKAGLKKLWREVLS